MYKLLMMWSLLVTISKHGGIRAAEHEEEEGEHVLQVVSHAISFYNVFGFMPLMI